MESVANGGQQAVAERHQRRGEQLVLGDEPRRLAHRRHLGVVGRRVAGPATRAAPCTTITPPERSSRTPSTT